MMYIIFSKLERAVNGADLLLLSLILDNTYVLEASTSVENSLTEGF